MSNSIFNYSKFTYSDIMAKINQQMAQHPNLASFGEAEIGQTILEMFGGMTDMLMYYIQRAAEENYFDTAQNRSSIINLARMFAYDIQRAYPAKGEMKVILKGDYSSYASNWTESKNITIQIPYLTKLSLSGKNFVLYQSFSYRLTDSDIADMKSLGSAFRKELTRDTSETVPVIIQGTLKEKIFEGKYNSQVGTSFQRYTIDDTTFSNLYGSNDYFPGGIATVLVGSNKDNARKFTIDRRSLITWDNINSAMDISKIDLTKPSDVCVMRTYKSDQIELMFGDQKYASIGANNRDENIYVQYLSTEGQLGNLNGVIGRVATPSRPIYTSDGINVSALVSFEMTTNVTMGSNAESSDSIKYHSPKIYYSLDRLVSESDYNNYLKTLTYPIDVKNAIAWGEQKQKKPSQFADRKSFNVVFYSLLGSLYNISSGTSSVKVIGKDLDSAVLDYGYDEDTINNQSIFNVYTRRAVAGQLKTFKEKNTYSMRVYGNNIVAEKVTDLDTLVYNAVQNLKATGLPMGSVPLKVTYKGYDEANMSYQSATTNITFKLSEMTTSAGASELFSTKIMEALLEVKDLRGYAGVNANYGLNAFSEISSEFYKFRSYAPFIMMVNSIRTNPCYITYLELPSTELNEVIGFEPENTNLDIVWQNSLYSTSEEAATNKIAETTKLLDTKGQVTISHVYVSPLIQSFKLLGNVYVKPLYDIEKDIRPTITNKIYQFMDTNADFNVPIRLSNLIELIESHVGVVNVDCYMKPDVIMIDDGTGGHEASFDDIFVVDPVGDDGYQWVADQCKVIYASMSTAHIKITEKIFFNDMLYTLWNNAKAVVGGSSDIRDDVSMFIFNRVGVTESGFDSMDTSAAFKDMLDMFRRACHKDIKYNMLDEYGNIENDPSSDVVCGYTMGNEIVKLDVSGLNYIYK